jgi:hypothetical protein
MTMLQRSCAKCSASITCRRCRLVGSWITPRPYMAPLVENAWNLRKGNAA